MVRSGAPDARGPGKLARSPRSQNYRALPWACAPPAPIPIKIDHPMTLNPFADGRDDVETVLPGRVDSRDLLRTTVREERDGVFVVVPVGEVDAATAGPFRDATLDAVRVASRQVLVDLSGVTFLGSAALAVLIDAHDAATSKGVACTPVAAGRAARRVLQLTGLDYVLGLGTSVDEVLRELR